jgi:hypothetical protein
MRFLRGFHESSIQDCSFMVNPCPDKKIVLFLIVNINHVTKFYLKISKDDLNPRVAISAWFLR